MDELDNVPKLFGPVHQLQLRHLGLLPGLHSVHGNLQ